MIVDAFTFCDEVDVLEIRLHLLAPVVSRFVAVEAAETFRGGQRDPLLKGLLADRLSRFASKVTVITLDRLDGQTPWQREAAQRGAIDVDSDHGDLVLVSDADEVPDPVVLAANAGRALTHPVAFAMQMHYFRLNVRTPWRSVYLPVLTRSDRLRLIGAQQVREQGGDYYVEPGGWEWSWLGSPADNVRKLSSFAHEELDTPTNRDEQRFIDALDSMEDPFGRFKLTPVPFTTDEGYPPWLVDNANRYSHLVAA